MSDAREKRVKAAWRIARIVKRSRDCDLTPRGTADGILREFDALAALLGYVKVDQRQWGVRESTGDVLTGYADYDEADRDVIEEGDQVVRRGIGPWEVAE